MSYSATATATRTYSVSDIESVVKRVLGDLLMIATSTATINEDKARQYAHDIELLARKGYLRAADVTLMSAAGYELRAVRYEVNTDAQGLSMSRPGGVMWPRVEGATLRVILHYTSDYTDEARREMADRLRIGWVPTNADTSHAGLAASGGRDYASNGYGMHRRDFGS